MPRASLRAVSAFDYGATHNRIKLPPLSGACLKSPAFGRLRSDSPQRLPEMAMPQKMSSKKSRPSYARHLPDKMLEMTSLAKQAPELDLLYYQREVETEQAGGPPDASIRVACRFSCRRLRQRRCAGRQDEADGRCQRACAAPRHGPHARRQQR